MIRFFAIFLLVASACTPLVVGGIYAEPPDKHCVFIKHQRDHEEESCWCAVEGRTEDKADAMLMVKVANKYCDGDADESN